MTNNSQLSKLTTANSNASALKDLNEPQQEVNDPELVFNLFLNRLIGPNKKTSYGLQPQIIGGGINSQEKMVMSAMESCSFKCLFSGVGGLGIGAIFGLFTASVDPMYTINPHKIPTMKEIALEMRNRAWSTGKNFAVIGMIFSVYECNIESYRGKSDTWNGFLGGFCTGGTLGLRVGVKPAIFGGIGFGLFSAAIEYALNSRS